MSVITEKFRKLRTSQEKIRHSNLLVINYTTKSPLNRPHSTLTLQFTIHMFPYAHASQRSKKACRSSIFGNFGEEILLRSMTLYTGVLYLMHVKAVDG